jgi:hypothetical protein
MAYSVEQIVFVVRRAGCVLRRAGSVEQMADRKKAKNQNAKFKSISDCQIPIED